MTAADVAALQRFVGAGATKARAADERRIIARNKSWFIMNICGKRKATEGAGPTRRPLMMY